MAYKYHIIFNKQEARFTEPTVTFSIGNIKSRSPSALYFIFRGYDMYDNHIYTYTSPRWVIDTEYQSKTRTFEISDLNELSDETPLFEEIAYTQIELVTVGIDSENPLYFNNLIFNDGEYIGYHTPRERVRKQIGFSQTRYCNLYDEENNYLQIIRPQGDAVWTDTLNASACTVIAPHLASESDIDSPVNVFYEFINQTEQRIDVLR